MSRRLQIDASVTIRTRVPLICIVFCWIALESCHVVQARGAKKKAAVVSLDTDENPNTFPNSTAEIIQLLQEPWASEVSVEPFTDERWEFGDQRDMFCFTHIPKCGGSALSVLLRSFLQRCTKQGTCQLPSSFRENRSIIHLKAQPLIAGYVGHHLACDKFLRESSLSNFPQSVQKSSQNVKEGQFWPIAIFREPVARVFSAYRHNLREVKKLPKPNFRCCGTPTKVLKQVAAQNMSLTEFAKTPGTDNVILRMVSGKGWYNGADGWATEEQFSEKEINLMLETAKDFIRKYAFIGLVEYWNISVDLFYATVGPKHIRQIKDYRHLVVPTDCKSEDCLIAFGKHGNQLDKKTREEIEAMNFGDVELYKFLRQEFVRRVHLILGPIYPEAFGNQK